MKKALITGITGQDGSYLAELLLNQGYEVHGIIRRSSTFNTSRIDHLYQDPHINGKRLFLHYGDLADGVQMVKLLYSLQPDEIYHLGAQSYVAYSFEDEFSTINTNINGTHYILSAIKDFSPKTKFYFAGSSEMFGKVVDMFYFPLYKGVLPDYIPFLGGDYFIFFRPVFNFADTCISIGVFLLILFNKKIMKFIN